jgi:DNA-binding transcriptional LysR family regulator
MLELRTDVRSLFLVGAHRVGRFAAIGAWLQNRWTCSSAACHCDELPMNFRQIEAFRHVMLHGSVTRAADAMSLSQPAVSHLVSDLEDWLGFTLFVRRAGQSLKPTNEAESLFAEVTRSFVGMEELTRAAKEIRTRRSGHLRVVAPAFIANSILCDATAAYLKRRTDSSAMIEVRNHNDIVDMVGSKVIDLAVAVLPVVSSMVFVEELGRFELLCAMRQDHPFAGLDRVSLEKLQDQDLITNTDGSQIGLATERLLQVSGVSVTRRVTVRNQEIACSLVARRVGIAIVARPLPDHVANYPEITFRPFEPASHITIGVLLPKSGEPSRLTTEFIECVRVSSRRLMR